MPFHLIRKKKEKKGVVRWRESKSLYEVLSPGQILSSVWHSLALENIIGSSALQGLINPATKMREKMEIHWLNRGIILCFATIGSKDKEHSPLDEIVSCFPLLTVKARLSFPGPVTITFHLEKSPLMGTGVFTLLWTELELRLADCRSHYMLCSWTRQRSHYILFDLYSNFLIHCLKKLPSNLVQS